MIKRTVLLLLTIISVQSIQAQTKWIVITGTSYSSFNTDLMGLYGFEDFRSDYLSNGGSASSPARNSIKVNGYIGIETDINLSEKGFIKTGLKYVSVGDSYNFSTKDIQYQDGYGSKTDARFIWRPRLDYIAVPLNYGFRPSEKLTLYGGLTPHINVDNLLRYNTFSGNAKDVKEEWERIDGPVDATKIVLFVNAGATYYLSSRTLLDLRILRSLGSVYDDAEVADEFNEAKIINVELGFGLILGGNKKSADSAN